MKIIFSGILVLALSACDSGESEVKEYFEGTVKNTLDIAGKDKIKSVTVELDSGSTINIFVEQNHSIKTGEKVKVFKYENSVVHYLSD